MKPCLGPPLIHRASSSKHLTAAHLLWHHVVGLIFTFRVRENQPMPAAVRAALFGNGELTASNTFSMLSWDPSTASQSSTGAHAERDSVTMFHAMRGHWLPPSIGFRLLHLLGISLIMPTVLLYDTVGET